jgi:hypothetical protein
MRRANNKPSHGERTRYLNIVYFVESARSHTIRVNLTYARWAVALAAIVAVWSIGSLFWIGHLQYQSARTHDRLEQALTTIFDYQIKNEKVFDEAYPPESTNGYYSELAQLPSNNPVGDITPTTTAKVDVKPSEKNIQATTAAKTASLAQPPAQPQLQASEVTKKAVSAVSQAQTTHPVTSAVVSKASEVSAVADSTFTNASGPQLEISGAKLSKADGHIYLNFNMKNKNLARAEGFIWAVAIIAQESGDAKPVVAPIHTRIDAKSGAILAPKTAYRFSILKFKNKEFEFKAPSKSNWKLSKLTIHYTNIEGRNEQKIEIPVEQVAISNIADTPATDIAL